MRDLHEATRAVIEASGVTPRQPVWLIEAEFRSATVRMMSAPGSLEWDGRTWYGPGSDVAAVPGGITGAAIVEIGAAHEPGKVEASGLKLTVSRFPTALLRYVDDEWKANARCNVYIGFLKADGSALEGDAIPWFPGWLDAAQLEEEPEFSRIVIGTENELRRLQQPVMRRLTNESQHEDFPSDDFFKFVPDQENFKRMWGDIQVGGNGGGGGGGGGTFGGGGPVDPHNPRDFSEA